MKICVNIFKFYTLHKRLHLIRGRMRPHQYTWIYIPRPQVPSKQYCWIFCSCSIPSHSLLVLWWQYAFHRLHRSNVESSIVVRISWQCLSIRLDLKETEIKKWNIFIFFQGITTIGEPSTSDGGVEHASDNEFSHTPPTPKRGRSTTPSSSSTTLKRDAMLGAAYERMMKEDDEWDKTALLLAEHMRNAVQEFPTLADDFRTSLH